jgi:hypothetical protein
LENGIEGRNEKKIYGVYGIHGIVRQVARMQGIE